MRKALDDFIPDLNAKVLDGIKQALNKFFPDEHFFAAPIEISSDSEDNEVVPPNPASSDDQSSSLLSPSSPFNNDIEDSLLVEIFPVTVTKKKKRRQTFYTDRPPTKNQKKSPQRHKSRWHG